MAAFNVSVDDSSPLISYSPAGAWTDSPINDSYSQRTWHTTSSLGASATLKFNGTGIWIFGSHKPVYGTYNISVDGRSVFGNAQSPTASFQKLLGGQSGLANGPHTAVFTNTGRGSAVDLDSIIFETQVGSAGSTVTKTTTLAINNLPTFGLSFGDWALNLMKGHFSTSRPFTQLAGPQTPFMFDGDAVAVYGTVSPLHANYTVTVDGVKHDFLGSSNGFPSDRHEGTLLFFANNLASHSHNLTLSANPGQPNTRKFMDLDRIVVFARNDTNSILSDNITSQPNGVIMPQMPKGNTAKTVVQGPAVSHLSKWLSPVVLKMIVAGSCIFILLLIVLVVVLMRRRRPLKMPSTPSLPIQTPPAISPREINPQNPFYDRSDLERGVEPPLLVVQLAPDDDPFADNVMRDDSNGELRNQGSVSSGPVWYARPLPLKLPPDSELG